MNIFGIGIGEIILVLVLAVVILGPDGMKKFARNAARSIHKLTHSPFWSELMDTRREINDLPQKLMKEAGIEKDVEEIKAAAREFKTVPQQGTTLLNNYQNYVKDLNKELNAPSSPKPETDKHAAAANEPVTVPDTQTEPISSTQEAETNDKADQEKA